MGVTPSPRARGLGFSPPPHPRGSPVCPGNRGGGGGGAGAAAAGADVMPVTGHARRLSAGAAVRASAAPLRQLDGGGCGGRKFSPV